MNKFGVSIIPKVLHFDKAKRDREKMLANILEKFDEWETEQLIQTIQKRYAPRS
jgi:hypothetical protein